MIMIPAAPPLDLVGQ